VKRAIVLAVFVACAVAVGGCGGSGVHLSRDEYERLPRDYRQEIFDAENDLVIARDSEDEAEDRKAAAESALDELSQTWRRTTARLSSTGQGAKLDRARAVHDGHVAYARALVDVADAAIRRAASNTRLSRGRLYLVRQRELARIGRTTVASLKPLENAVGDLESASKAASADELTQRARVQTQLTAWKTAEDAYVAASGDYDTGVWGD
jgi:hypothetical protein